MSIKPLLLNVKPISEITTVNNPIKGHLLFYDGGDELKKVDISEFQSLIGGIAKPLAIADATPTTAGWYKPTTSGTYSNAGGLVAQVGYDTLFYFDGTTWSKVEVKMPTPIENYYTNNNTYNLEPEQIVPSEALYPDSTLAGDILKRVSKVGVDVNYKEVTTYYDGTAMSDAKCDGYIYIKVGTKFYKQIFDAIIDVRKLGILPNGQDMTAQFNLALQVFKNTGATFQFSADEYIFAGQIIFPYEVISNTPTQKPFKFKGASSYFNGKQIGENGKKGTVINLNYNGNGSYQDAKVKSFGLGILSLEDICFQDLTGDNTPFFYSTYTTWSVKRNAFLGSKNGVNADQDVFFLGGTDETEIGDNPNGGFQGYGTVIEHNYFNGIRRGIVGQNYFNGNVIQNNIFWFQCGNANGGAIEFLSSSVQTCTGNVVQNNLVEMQNYKHFFVGVKANNNSFMNNNLFDEGTTTTSYYNLDNSDFNVIINGWHSDAKPLIIGSKKQTVITAHDGQYSFLPSIKSNYATIETKEVNATKSAVEKNVASTIEVYSKYDIVQKVRDLIRKGTDGVEKILFRIKDYNDDYFSYIFAGVDPRLDSDNNMKVRAFTNKELFLGDQSGKGVTVLYGNVIYKQTDVPIDKGTYLDNNNIMRFKKSASVTKSMINESCTTSTRPKPASVGAGEMIFDTTLGKPIWSDGTNWKDATGATV